MAAYKKQKIKMKRGKVGCGGREIMAALWGSRGRPETEAYADACAESQRNRRQPALRSLVVTEVSSDGPRLRAELIAAGKVRPT